MKTKAALALACALAAGCAAPPPKPAAAPPQEPQAEKSLAEGTRAYDDGQYLPAEAALRRALAEGLKRPRDQATAHKLLAFITCTSNRVPDCEAAFKAARAADPAFVLSKSEAGHPLWGPVYKRVLP